ncbi:hypothetical protein L7F22_048356 [Adiantum nelumboides]|nr:hypothetical protein [Adiantum nelumboides]
MLKRAALWDIVSGTTPKPAANDADWLAKDLQAQSKLMLHLGDRQVQMVRRCQSSPEIWAFLCSTYHHKDLITRVTALKKLLLAVLTKHQDISKFLDDWRTLLDNALLSGLLLDDSLQAMLLLAALPTSWRPFITTQASVVGLTVETLIARILQEDAMRGNSTPTTIPSSQYVQRQSNFRRRPFRRFNNTTNPVNNPTPAKICIHCGRHGHLVHECRTKRQEQQRTDRRPRSQLQHIEVPALSQYGMESLQLFTSMLNSTRDLATSTDTSVEWLLDTGATHHMTPTSSWLRDYKTLARHVQVYLGDNHCLHAIGLGNLHVTLPSGAAIIIRDIYHIPGLRRNILSVTAATSSGSSIEFFHDLCVIHFKLPNGQFEIIKLPQQNRLYPIKLTQSGHNTVIVSTSIITLYLTKTVSTLMWHYRLGHINGHTLQRMAKHGLCSGLPPNLSSIDLCEGCIMGKASHKPFHRSQSRSSQLNQLVHSDLCGPMESASITADALYHQVLQAFSDDDFDRLLLVVETIDEISLDEALSGPEASSWRQAMDSEYQSLMANGTWQLVPAPPNRKLVTCKWLLRKKFHADGSVSRYKARLVARGFTQIPGMDYSETFSPVLRITSFRVLIAIAALFGFLLHQMDVRTAFLNGDLQEEIYMSQPDGGYTSLQHPDYVCRLLKALYGLKQSPRQWYLRFHQCMISLGYTRFQSDANVYSRHSTNVLLFLAIYVDDILILSNSQYAIDKAKGELQASFSMIDMGTLHYCLGIQVLQDPSKGLIRISQQTYIQSLLTKFNMSSSKGVETPLPTSLKLKQPDSTVTVSIETQSFPFANILGGIRYLVTCTRPDICFATNLLSRYMKAPSLQHIQHLKRLMRYLQHTKDYGICFYATHPLPTPFLFGYSDADWGGDQETLQSTSGFVYLLARGSISWQSKKQDRVTLSSTEAEYVAMTLALKEGIWLKHLLMETTLFANQPLRLLCDNMSAIMLARNLKHFEKTKHIAMKLKFIRELIQEGTIELTHVRSDQQLADFLTKSIPKAKHLESCQQLGICNLNYQLRGVCADIAL